MVVLRNYYYAMNCILFLFHRTYANKFILFKKMCEMFSETPKPAESDKCSVLCEDGFGKLHFAIYSPFGHENTPIHGNR